MCAARIPLTVIGGFLGAGKTTLVNRVLAGLAGVRAAVLVNDFGAVNIDAGLIASREGETVSLSNGCVCCSIGGDLTDALIRVMERRPPPDWIVIEASGVSDPWRIAQVGLADPALALDGVVVLADAEAVRAQAADRYLADTVLRQLAAADLVILNKSDLVSANELRATREWLEQLAPGTPVFDTRDADVPLAVLTSIASRPKCEAREVMTPLDHGERFATWTLVQEGTFSAAKLRALLKAMPEGVLRAKGVVATDELPTALLQFSGRRGSLRAAPEAADRPSCVVVIGLRDQLAAARLDEVFRDALLRA